MSKFTEAKRFWGGGFVWILILGAACSVWAQSTARLRGTVVDAQGSVVPEAMVTLLNSQTGVGTPSQTDNSGIFEYPALPPGNYHIEISHPGFQKLVIDGLRMEVGSTVSKKFELMLGQVSQTVSVTSEAPTIETASVSVGQVINEKTVQEIPLNGRHFVDLGLLIPGTVTPPQNGFLTAPLRGQGSFAFNTAGNREDTTNFMVNGINLNDMSNNQITFQPSINTVSEFKVDNSTFRAEYGRNSGSIVNIATRSGTNQFHGEVFEYFRNNVLDARNLFNYVTTDSNPLNPQDQFRRNNFGASVGGPIVKNHTFFFLSYEGLRHRQGININTLVLSDEERASAQAAGNPTILKLLPLIPPANLNANTTGSARFVGSATAPVNLDQGTADISHTFSSNDQLHGYYAIQQDLRGEPTLQATNLGNDTIPGFGDTRQSRRQLFTLGETHTFSTTIVNEARLGFNRIHILFTPKVLANPADFGINDGVTAPIGLPMIVITTLTMSMGGPQNFPQGRGDTTGVFSDTLSWLHGRHSFKFGGEYRRFYNDAIALDTGAFRFFDAAHFITGKANVFQITQGNASDKLAVGAVGVFVQDTFQWKPGLTWELGFRYDWNMTPAEANNRVSVYLPASNSLVQVGTNGVNSMYYDNNKNFEPRVGFAWDPFGNGKTSVRAAYSILTDQPVTGLASVLTGNPPFATPVQVNSKDNLITFSNAATFSAGSIAPVTVNPDFRNPYVQDWNFNVQRELPGAVALMVGYFGSKGTHLRIARNINQPASPTPGAMTSRVNASLSPTSPVDPGVKLTNITEADSSANSSYNALWVAANKGLAHGLQFNASYTYSHSLDYNSLSNNTIVVQDSTNIQGSRGSSDFDARHRFVINWLYELPFHGNRIKDGWQLAAITQWQSGNPVNIVVQDATFTGVPSTVRPDLTGAITYPHTTKHWFDPSGFAFPGTGGTVTHFGNLPRNAVDGPTFSNTDFTVQKTTAITESKRLQFRADMFDVFNHPNLGQPGRIAMAGSTKFGKISNTRFPGGDSGSSRQVQFALRLLF
jgi:hypothetical protein